MKLGPSFKKKKVLLLESLNNNNSKRNKRKIISIFSQLFCKWVDKKPSAIIHKCISRLYHFLNFPDAFLAVVFSPQYLPIHCSPLLYCNSFELLCLPETLIISTSYIVVLTTRKGKLWCVIILSLRDFICRILLVHTFLFY